MLRRQQLGELRRRIEATRWPSHELAADRSQDVQLATLHALAHYWTTEYDWRKCEARLKALPQFVTHIDGVDIHFIHVKSPHENALPLIMTHGWPGSVIELLETIGPLTDPTAHGGQAEDAFHFVLPSLPGYGFSREPAELGWNVGRVAQAWAELMHRLGSPVMSPRAATWAPPSPTDGTPGTQGAARHPHEPARDGARRPPPTESEQERAAADQLATFRESGFGYFLEMATRPQTIGYALQGSPVALAAWLLAHDTDSYYKIASAFVNGEPAGNLTRDHILDNVTLHWLTGTAPRQPAPTGRTHSPGPRYSPPARPHRTSRSRSASPPSPANSGGPRAAGSRTPTPTSPTSTRSTRAATSPRGKSPSSSPPSCGLHSTTLWCSALVRALS
jgi:Epoxide hydrolase N terminus